MNLSDAEAVLALEAELASALELGQSESEFRTDWRVQFAAERVLERDFQASEAISAERPEQYFGADGVRYLRGIRNRLSHNYLAIDHDILWETISVDLPLAYGRLAADATDAAAVVGAEAELSAEDEDSWLGSHLRSTRDPE